MTPNEINLEIQKDFDSFNNGRYEANVLPKDIMERFKKALFLSTAHQHGKSSETLIKLITKKAKELTNYEAGFVLNTVKSVRHCDMYQTLEEALTKTKEIEGLVIDYNLMVKEINEAAELKRNNLMALTGQGNAKIKTLAQA